MKNKKLWKILAVLTLVLSLVLSITACGSSKEDTPADAEASQAESPSEDAAETSEEADTAEEDDVLHFGYVAQSLSNSFHIATTEAFKSYCAELGIECTALAAEDITEQTQKVSDLIQSKPDAIGIDSFDMDAMSPFVDEALAAGIAVFAVDNRINNDGILMFTGTDNTYGGEKAAEWIVDKMGGEGKLGIILGTAGSAAGNDRRDGLGKVLADYPDIEIVAEIVGNYKRDLGMTAAADMITANPDIDCIFCMNDEMAFGAAEAIKDAGKEDDILLVGFNGVDEAVRAVNSGSFDATVVQFPETMIKNFVDAAVAYLKDGTAPEAEMPVVAEVVDTELANSIMDGSYQPASEVDELIAAKVEEYCG